MNSRKSGMNKKKNENKLIAVSLLSGRIGSSFNASVIRGVEDRASHLRNHKFEISYHSPSEMTKGAVSSELRSIINNRHRDAVIILGCMADDKTLKLLEKSRIPCVFIERKAYNFHSIVIDNYKCGFMAGEYLSEQGRVKTAVILDRQAKESGSPTNLRFKGFKDSLAKKGINHNCLTKTMVERHTIDHGRAAFDSMEEKIKDTDSVFSVAGDFAAIGFMMEARSHGIKIPDDICVLGFDDIEMASAVSPALTTIRQPITEMGSKAVEILSNIFSGKIAGVQDVVLESDFIKRESA